jgi:hypothetical protein
MIAVLEITKGMIQKILKNVSNKAITVAIKGMGSKTLYPGDSMRIDNGTRYTAKFADI